MSVRLPRKGSAIPGDQHKHMPFRKKKTRKAPVAAPREGFLWLEANPISAKKGKKGGKWAREIWGEIASKGSAKERLTNTETSDRGSVSRGKGAYNILTHFLKGKTMNTWGGEPMQTIRRFERKGAAFCK